MEEKLVKTLIENYKNQGIDLYAILDEPLFMSLNLEQKVKLLKQFASHISSGTTRVLTKKDIRAIILDTSVAGLFSGAAAGIGAAGALAFYNKGKLPLGTIAGSILLGGGVTALSTLLNTNKILNQRKAIINSLDNLNTSNTDENAIRTLILRNSQVRPNSNLAAPSAIGSMVKSHINDIPLQIVKGIKPYVNAMTIYKNETNLEGEYKPGVDPEKMKSVVQQAIDTLHFKN